MLNDTPSQNIPIPRGGVVWPYGYYDSSSDPHFVIEGWSAEENGRATVYYEDDYFRMPEHNMILYPILSD